MTFLVITAGQRAGTTTLEAALGTTGAFAYCGEIFHTESDRTDSFCAWSRERRFLAADFMDTAFVTRVLAEYFDFLADAAPVDALTGAKRIPLLDIKFNSWLAVSDAWRYPSERPLAMHLLIERGATFMLIRRRDLVSQILSECIAERLGKWHDLTPNDLPTEGSLELNLDLVRWRAKSVLHAEQFCSEQLVGAEKIEVWYENLFADGCVSEPILQFAETVCRRSIHRPLRLPIARNAGDKRSLVGNYEAAEAIIRELAPDRTGGRWEADGCRFDAAPSPVVSIGP